MNKDTKSYRQYWYCDHCDSQYYFDERKPIKIEGQHDDLEELWVCCEADDNVRAAQARSIARFRALKDTESKK